MTIEELANAYAQAWSSGNPEEVVSLGWKLATLTKATHYFSA